MTRYRTFRPRGMRLRCSVCDEVLRSVARCCVLGRYMCSRHGAQSRRFEKKALLDHHPRLAIFLRQHTELSWIPSMLRSEIQRLLVRFPLVQGTPRLRRVIPYGEERPSVKARLAVPKQCGECHVPFEEGTDVRRFRSVPMHRACYVRSQRQHQRARSQFAALLGLARRGAAWVVPMLDPLLSERITKHLARRGPRRFHDTDRWV